MAAPPVPSPYPQSPALSYQWSLRRTLSRSLGSLRVPNFSRYALPELDGTRLGTDFRDTNIDCVDSGSDVSDYSVDGKDQDLSSSEDEEEIEQPPPLIRRQSSRLRRQNVPPRKPLPSRGLRRTFNAQNSPEDQDLVTWDGKNDPRNPLCWTKRKKWIATVLVSSFTFISPVASTMVAPALPDIAQQFDITSKTEQMLVMSIFLLAYAVGPFVLGPLSEIYGRVVVLQSANMVYLIFNTACGFAQTKEQMMAFRFLSGLGGSAPQAIGGGVLSDCWAKEERGSAIALYSLAPFLGPAVGPIAG